GAGRVPGAVATAGRVVRDHRPGAGGPRPLLGELLLRRLWDAVPFCNVLPLVWPPSVAAAGGGPGVPAALLSGPDLGARLLPRVRRCRRGLLARAERARGAPADVPSPARRRVALKEPGVVLGCVQIQQNLRPVQRPFQHALLPQVVIQSLVPREGS